MNITELILDALKKSGTPMKSSEIAEKAGVEKKDVDKVLKKLKKDEAIISPKRCYYSTK